MAKKEIDDTFIKSTIEEFLKANDRRPIYNEFSFQHELGFFLREKITKKDENFKVEFERNVSYFGVNEETCKKEIDIVIYKDKNSKKNRYAIELNYHPIDSGITNRMKDSIKDIWFMEQLLEYNFKTFVCVIAEDKRFYKDKARKNSHKINQYFLNKNPETIEGKIDISKNDNDLPAEISGSYVIKWNDLKKMPTENCGERKYYLLETNNRNKQLSLKRIIAQFPRER